MDRLLAVLGMIGLAFVVGKYLRRRGASWDEAIVIGMASSTVYGVALLRLLFGN